MHIVQAIGAHLEKLGHTLVPTPIVTNYPRIDTKTSIIYFNLYTDTIRVRDKRVKLESKEFAEFSPSDPSLLQKVADVCESSRSTI